MEIGGIDANQIVTDLMALERQPLFVLEQRQEAAEVAANALSSLRSKVDSFRFASLKLAGSDAFSRFTASSSNSSAVTASATSTASPASLTFSVAQLAGSHGLRSVGTVATSDTQITTASTISIATGGASFGIGMVRSGAALTADDRQISITQASAAASRKSDAPLTAATLASSEFVDIEIDGTATSIELVAGSYTPTQLAAAIDLGLSNAGLDASASLDSDGALVISTNGEGSAATLQVTGGSGLARIGMTVDASARTGTDAVVTIGETTTTLTDLAAGSTVTVATGDGDIELDLTGGLRVGVLDVSTVDVGSGSLAEVAAAVNQSQAGASAAAIRVGEGEWRLQLTARTAGEDGELLIDDSVFTGLGGLIESSAARNAQIVVGEGAGEYTVESSTNTFGDVLAGTSITVSEVTTSQVTVGVSRDDAGLAKEISAMVSAANIVLADFKVQTRFGADGTGNGALAGNGSVRRIADQLRASLSRPVEGFNSLIGADVGIEIDRDGGFTFDEAAFKTALAEDPAGVARFFGRSATAPAGATFSDAAPETQAGSYDVEVTTAATQATSALLFDGGASTTLRIGVRVGSLTATVDVDTGQSAAEITEALNDAIAAAGLEDITAEISAGGLVVRSDRWGSSGDFELNLDVTGAGTWDATAGTDVEGTIDGIDAAGLGRTLSLASTADSSAAGLALDIDGGVTGALGAVEYQPGIAARVAAVTTQLIDEDGALDSASSAQERRISDFNDQIDQFEDRLFTRETNLRRQWASLQTLLQQLQERGSWLSSQLASLPQINAG